MGNLKDVTDTLLGVVEIISATLTIISFALSEFRRWRGRKKQLKE